VQDVFTPELLLVLLIALGLLVFGGAPERVPARKLAHKHAYPRDDR
jgi:hypothetical protein